MHPERDDAVGDVEYFDLTSVGVNVGPYVVEGDLHDGVDSGGVDVHAEAVRLE